MQLGHWKTMVVQMVAAENMRLTSTGHAMVQKKK